VKDKLAKRGVKGQWDDQSSEVAEKQGEMGRRLAVCGCKSSVPVEVSLGFHSGTDHDGSNSRLSKP
jgi:hypothetical protein